MIDVYATIVRIQSEKQEKGISPDHVLDSELLSDIVKQAKDEANALSRSGKLSFGKTINNIWIRANEAE